MTGSPKDDLTANPIECSFTSVGGLRECFREATASIGAMLTPTTDPARKIGVDARTPAGELDRRKERVEDALRKAGVGGP